MTPAQMIADELRAVVHEDTLQAFVDDDSGHDSLRYYETIVKIRLGGDYDASAWHDACQLLRED